ncbi:hypothetical protein Hdeb2414_s0064g00765841 [Helianthus debilis subsp. tardiflorus]
MSNPRSLSSFKVISSLRFHLLVIIFSPLLFSLFSLYLELLNHHFSSSSKCSAQRKNSNLNSKQPSHTIVHHQRRLFPLTDYHRRPRNLHWLPPWQQPFIISCCVLRWPPPSSPPRVRGERKRVRGERKWTTAGVAVVERKGTATVVVGFESDCGGGL